MEIIGHQEGQTAIIESLTGGAFPHAWLLYGARGIGKGQLAIWAARYILGGREAVDDEAHPVARAVLLGSHPDLQVIKADEKSGKTKEISINKIRELNEKIRLTSAHGGWRVVVIDPVCSLTNQAANALLKTVEEPPSRVAFLMPCHHIGQIQPTLVSRCRRLPLFPPNREQFAQILARSAPRTLKPEEIEQLFVLSEGAPGVALELKDWGCVELYRLLSKVLAGNSKVAQHEFVTMLERDKDSDSWRLYALLMRGILRRALLSKAEGTRGGAQENTREGAGQGGAEVNEENKEGNLLAAEAGLFARTAPTALLKAISTLAELDERVPRAHLSHPNAILVSLEGIAKLA